jgi:regulator of sigma E protease
MLIVTVLLGLLGLGVVVLVHELGHFAAARAMGVEVEAFSIGWGPKIAGFKRGGVEWRFSVLPIGGYCKMKGEDSFRKALEAKSTEMPREAGSFYGAAPWRRIVISLAGPIANVLFAIVAFVVVSTISYSVPTFPNRVALVSEYDLGGPRQASYPADAAGLRTGDRILSVDGRKVADFSDLLQGISLSANRPLRLEIERDGARLSKTVTPMLDKNTGGGLIGVTYWAEPIIGSVAKGSSAEIAGLATGDLIVAINGKPARHAVEALSILNSAKPERAQVEVERGGQRLVLALVLSWNDQGRSNLGISFRTDTHTIKGADSLGAALTAGLGQTWSTFEATLKGLGSLFQGVDLLKALSGPARITYLVGQSATEGIQRSASGGLALPIEFLAFLSIGLFIMNLLPIPALDGGQIVMFAVEAARKRGLKPSTIYRYQFIGATFILAIFAIATVGDLLFFAAR